MKHENKNIYHLRITTIYAGHLFLELEKKFKSDLQMWYIKHITLKSQHIYIYAADTLANIPSIPLCSLFNDSVSISDYTAMNNWMVVNNELNKIGRNWLQPNLRYYTGISLA
jgi:hypothetical protein